MAENKAAQTKSGEWLPLDHSYWHHEAEAIRLMHALEAEGWEFWS